MNFYKVSLNNKISQLFGTEFLFSSPFPYFCNLSHKTLIIKLMEISDKYNPQQAEQKWYQYWQENKFFIPSQMKESHILSSYHLQM